MRSLEVYRKAGFTPDQASIAHRTVVRFTTGAVMSDLQHLRSAGFTAGTLSVPEDEWLASETGEQLEREFDGGLSIIIAGLAEFRSGRATTA
jgi:hypothetical protein